MASTASAHRLLRRERGSPAGSHAGNRRFSVLRPTGLCLPSISVGTSRVSGGTDIACNRRRTIRACGTIGQRAQHRGDYGRRVGHGGSRLQRSHQHRNTEHRPACRRRHGLHQRLYVDVGFQPCSGRAPDRPAPSPIRARGRPRARVARCGTGTPDLGTDHCTASEPCGLPHRTGRQVAPGGRREPGAAEARLRLLFGFIGRGHDYWHTDANALADEYLIPLVENHRNVRLDGYLTDVLTDKGHRLRERFRSCAVLPATGVQCAANAPGGAPRTAGEIRGRSRRLPTILPGKWSTPLTATSDASSMRRTQPASWTRR